MSLPGRAARPKVVAFDIIETVFRIDALGDRLAGLGLPAGLYARLYAEALRDAVSLAAVGGFAPFLAILAANLRTLLAEHGLEASEAEIHEALAAMRELPAQPGAPEAFARLKAGRVRVFALSNGAKASTESLLDRAGMADSVEAVLSVESVKLAKPRAEVYRFAAETAALRPAELMLVACHPWDVNGAMAAGLLGGFVSRGKPYPAGIMAEPTLVAVDLSAMADAILAMPA